MKPLFKWAGGKNKMIPKYENNPGIPLDGYDTYVEPFFGGGAMMIYIAKNCPNIKKYIINDINSEIVGVYTSIKNDVEAFKSRVSELESQWLPLTKEERKKYYYSLRGDYINNKWSSTEESATLYFLMKTSFNGIWQTMKISNGRFATPVGKCDEIDKVYDVENVDEWHIFLQKAEIYSGDWSSCVNNIDGKAFYFMDPPYIDSFTSYSQTFDKNDQLQLLTFCKESASNGNIVFFCNRYDGSNIWLDNKGDLSIEYYDIKYTAGRRATEESGKKSAKKAVEVLLYHI